MPSFKGTQEYIYNDEKYAVRFCAEYTDERKVKIGDVEVHDIYRPDGSMLPVCPLWADIAQNFPHGDGIEEALVELAEKDQQWQEDRRISDRILNRR